MCNQCLRAIKTTLAAGPAISYKPKDSPVTQVGYTEEAVQNCLENLAKCPAMKTLEELTPMGSEYWEDPVHCSKAIKFVQDSRWKMLLKFTVERNDLLLKIDELKKELDVAITKLYMANDTIKLLTERKF